MEACEKIYEGKKAPLSREELKMAQKKILFFQNHEVSDYISEYLKLKEDLESVSTVWSN